MNKLLELARDQYNKELEWKRRQEKSRWNRATRIFFAVVGHEYKEHLQEHLTKIEYGGDWNKYRLDIPGHYPIVALIRMGAMTNYFDSCWIWHDQDRNKYTSLAEAIVKSQRDIKGERQCHTI